MQGRNGSPLNEIGIQQAEQVKEKLQHIEFDLVISSPQERAVQTAEIATGKKAVIDNRIDVFDLGEADRLTTDEVKIAKGIPDPTLYKGVEDPYDYIKRVFDFMRDLEAEYGDKRVLISGHRCTTGGIGAYFEGIPEDENILRYSSNNGDYKVYEFQK